MPGYPCCCSKDVECVYCSGNRPSQLLVTLPYANSSNSTQCQNCTSLKGTYTLDPTSSTNNCAYATTFYKDLSPSNSTTYENDCSTDYPWTLLANAQPSGWNISLWKKIGVGFGSTNLAANWVGTNATSVFDCSTNQTSIYNTGGNWLCRFSTDSVTIVPIM